MVPPHCDYLTLAEFFTERYNSKTMAGFYAVTQTLMFMIAAAGGFTAMSKTVAAIAEKPETALTEQQSAERGLALELRELKDKDYRLLDAAEQQRLATLTEAEPAAELLLHQPQLRSPSPWRSSSCSTPSRVAWRRPSSPT